MKIPSRIPGSLSIRGGSTDIFVAGPASYDYAFNGLPFLSCASMLDYGRRKIWRKTAPFRKDQVDQAMNPGEQSLAGYWLRSQLSFHGGAGLVYNDTGNDNPFADIRFNKSKNVNPWVRGEISMLSKAVAAGLAKTGIIKLISFTFGDGTGAVGGIEAASFFYQKTTGATASTTFVPVVYSVTTNGSTIFVSAADGLYKATINASTISAFTKIYTYTVTTGSVVEFVKERLILSVDAALYEVSPTATGPAALPAAIYTSAIPTWVWTSVSETTSAIYAAGSALSKSTVLKFTLVTVAGVPTLSSGSIACQLPGGEVAKTVFGYLGDKLALGTNRGARIAEAAASGDLTYGPLIFETTQPVTAFAGFDRFIWAAYAEAGETDIRVARIDLSLQIEQLRFAWATDLVGAADTNATTALAFMGGTNILSFATSANWWVEDQTKKPTTASLDTARVRLSTIEPKVFRNVRVRGPALLGALGISVLNEDNSVTPLYTYAETSTPGLEDINLPSPNRRNVLALRFTLSANAGGTAGAVMTGWQVKALPGSPRQRMITLPMWCFDFETDKHGQRVGGHTKAESRLRALEALDEAGDVVTYQDLDTGVQRDVFIEEMEFEQSDPPPHFKGWGGIIRITFRTI